MAVVYYAVDRNDVVSYEPRNELMMLEETHALPRWAYTTSEWTRLSMARLKLKELIKEQDKDCIWD